MSTSGMKKNILILSSMGLHLKPLASRLRGIRKLDADPWGTRIADIDEYSLYLCKTGQGQEQSGVSTEELVRRYQPVHVFYLGLAGALRQDIKSPSVFFVSRIKKCISNSRDISVNQVISLSSVFDDYSTPLVTQAKGKSRVFRGSLLSVAEYNGGFQERKRLKKTGIELLDIESGAVAEVVTGAGIAFTCLMSVSDDTMEKFPLYSVSESGKGINPPPRKVIKALTAAKALGSVAHMWLLRFCLK